MNIVSAHPHFWNFAQTPPMGWNSWDCFATTVREEQVREHAQIMAHTLKPFGWEYVVVDIQWYEPDAKSFEYRQGAHLVTDAYGRLLPAEGRFPSAKGGTGFTKLAQDVHALGLKFGIHLMRGIPRQCVEANTPIFGTQFHAKDIADKKSTCAWNPDMYGVDMTKPGAQAYYDSVFSQIARWGVDFVKVDDIARPYNRLEIEAIRTAIDKCGRAIVLSLSPGETPVASGDHVAEHANMWRISDDFWDSWPALVEQFERCHKWSKFVDAGHFPDADMLPLGYVRFGEKSHFTVEEQRTMLSLWCMVRSPLMLGCDLTKLDKQTLELITNPEIIEVDQHSINPHQVSRDGDQVVWESRSRRDHTRYMACFNLGDNSMTQHVPIGNGSSLHIRDLWLRRVLGPATHELELVVPAHGSRLIAIHP